jgi:glucuronate isomerase
MSKLILDPDRLFPAAEPARSIARELFSRVEALPIVSPHGHTDPAWFADDTPFEDATSLILIPDHYLFRMLHSQGVRLDELGIARVDGSVVETDRRKIWHIFASRYYLFRGTPSRLWLDHVFHTAGSRFPHGFRP